MKLTINRVKLIAALEAQLKKFEAEDAVNHERAFKATAEYAAELKTYADRLALYATALIKAKTREAQDAVTSTAGYGPNKPYLPTKATQSSDAVELRQTLRTLKLSDQETIEAHKTDSYLKYL